MIINLPHQGRHFVSRVSRRCFLKFQNQSENQLTPETRCSACCVVVCSRATFLVFSRWVFLFLAWVWVFVWVSMCRFACVVYVLLFAKKLTFKTQKSAQVACICVLFSRLACLCLFVCFRQFADTTRQILRLFDFCFVFDLSLYAPIGLTNI